MLIVANYKMNGDSKFYSTLINKLNKVKDTKLILCPPFVYLPYLSCFTRLFSLGAQDVCCAESGKYTGQVSAEMLKDFKVKYCIVGHSERRGFETNLEVAGKVKECLKQGIMPILCVGESVKDENEEVLVEQLTSALAGVGKDKKAIVAYEPVWAIGSGVVPTNTYINKKVALIKKILKDLGLNLPILYGGSVDEKNCLKLKKCKIDGFFVGGLSLQFEKLLYFRRLVCEKEF